MHNFTTLAVHQSPVCQFAYLLNTPPLRHDGHQSPRPRLVFVLRVRVTIVPSGLVLANGASRQTLQVPPPHQRTPSSAPPHNSRSGGLRPSCHTEKSSVRISDSAADLPPRTPPSAAGDCATIATVYSDASRSSPDCHVNWEESSRAGCQSPEISLAIMGRAWWAVAES